MSCRRWLVLLAALVLFVPACGWDGHLNILGYTTRPNYDCSIRTVYVPIFENRTLTPNLRLEFELTREVVRQIEEKTPYKVVSCRDNADTELTGTIVSINKGIVNRNQLNEVREAELTIGVEIVWRDCRTGLILSQPDRGPDAPPIAPGGVRPGAVPSPKTGPDTVTPLMPAGNGTQAAAATANQGVQTPARPTSATSPISAASSDNGLAVPGGPVPPPPPPASVPPGTPVPPGAPPPVEPVSPPVLVQATGRFIPELAESWATGQKMMLHRLAVQIVSMMEKPW